MNTFLIIITAVVFFCYFGGNNCPSVLRQNKEMLLGVLVGLALCLFMGVKLVEGASDEFKTCTSTTTTPGKYGCSPGYVCTIAQTPSGGSTKGSCCRHKDTWVPFGIAHADRDCSDLEKENP